MYSKIQSSHTAVHGILNCAIAFFSFAKGKSSIEMERIQLYRMLCTIRMNYYLNTYYLVLLIQNDWNPLYLSECSYVCVCVCLLPFRISMLGVGVCKQISNAKWCFQFTLVFLATHNFDNV